MTEDSSIVPEPDTEAEGDTVRAAFARLYSDGRAYADAEIERQKLRAGIAGSGVRDAAIFGMAGFLLVLSALIALLVGLIMTLAPHIGPGWATAAVFGGSLIIALALLLIAKSRITRMRKALRS
ncbi:hypothetical protein BV96_01938 [Sphingomonas paucimobilis]|nr:hypothetical protein BV96_01938 [Sphingomonas paucimobilis]